MLSSQIYHALPTQLSPPAVLPLLPVMPPLLFLRTLYNAHLLTVLKSYLPLLPLRPHIISAPIFCILHSPS